MGGSNVIIWCCVGMTHACQRWCYMTWTCDLRLYDPNVPRYALQKHLSLSEALGMDGSISRILTRLLNSCMSDVRTCGPVWNSQQIPLLYFPFMCFPFLLFVPLKFFKSPCVLFFSNFIRVSCPLDFFLKYHCFSFRYVSLSCQLCRLRCKTYCHCHFYFLKNHFVFICLCWWCASTTGDVARF